MALDDNSRDWVEARTRLLVREGELIAKITSPRTPADEYVGLRGELAGIRWALALEQRKNDP